jgi:hypothetical protein
MDPLEGGRGKHAHRRTETAGAPSQRRVRLKPISNGSHRCWDDLVADDPRGARQGPLQGAQASEVLAGLSVRAGPSVRSEGLDSRAGG